MTEPLDHEIKLRLRASEWLAIKRIAEDDDRPLAGYIRRLITAHLAQVSATEAARDRDAGGQQ